MFTPLLRYLPHLAVFAALAGGVLFYGHTRYDAGQASVQTKWDAAIVEAERAARETEERHDAIAKELQDALTEKGGRLDAAESSARSLADRLRSAQARRCVPPAAGATPGAADPGRESADGGGAGARIDEAVADHFAACSRDAARLDGWREWWGAIQAAEPNL